MILIFNIASISKKYLIFKENIKLSSGICSFFFKKFVEMVEDIIDDAREVINYIIKK